MDNEMMQFVTEGINKSEGWFATTYTRDEVTKIITEPVTHIVASYENDEFDIVYDRGEWVVSCERADFRNAAHLHQLLLYWELTHRRI